jgi:hypothetical protein
MYNNNNNNNNNNITTTTITTTTWVKILLFQLTLNISCSLACLLQEDVTLHRGPHTV